MNADLFATDGGIYLGYASETVEGPPPSGPEAQPLRYIGDRHVLTYGPNGSGKSRRSLLPNLLLLTGWSILVVDIKGELAAQTLAYRSSCGNDGVLLNPYDALGMGSHGWNPVAALDPAGTDFLDDAQSLAEAQIVEQGNDPHWAASAQDLFCACTVYSRLTQPGGGSLGHVRELLGKPSLEFVGEVDAMMETGIRSGWDELTTKAGRFRDLTPENRELHSILSTAMTQSRNLDSRPLKADLVKGTFDFTEMRQRPMTAYAILPANRLGAQKSWLRLVITAFLQSVLKDARQSRVPLLLMVDEAAQLGEIPLLRDSIALLRSYGCKVWLVFQDVVMHKAIAGDRFESVAANCGVLQALAPQDMTTAKFLSERTGQTTGDVLSYAAPLAAYGGKPGEGNLTLSQTPLPAMLPQDLINMDEGYAVLFSHKTKGTIRSYLPDPSEVASFDTILQKARPPKPKAARGNHAGR